MQFGDPFSALFDFAVDAEGLRRRSGHALEKTCIGGLVAFSAGLVEDIASEGGDFGVPVGIEDAEFGASASKGSVDGASVGDETVGFGCQAVPRGRQ